MFSIRGPSRARAYSKEPLLPASSDDLPRSERSWSPSRKQRGWKRKLVPLRRREVYLFLLLGLACYTWSIERMWDREWVDWKRAASVEGSGASDSDGRSTTEMVYSHNDEMQGLDALNLALSLGFGAIEVDTWLVDTAQRRPSRPGSEYGASEDVPSPNPSAGIPKKGLIIGHKRKDLAGRSLQSIYLDPLRNILDERNRMRNASADWTGLYEHSTRLEVQVVIDFKSNGQAMWPYVSSALEPLRASGYLTTYNVSSSTWTLGPLRIIGTGNTPLSHVYHSPLRCIFFDANLLDLRNEVSIPASEAGPAAKFSLTPEIAPMASAKFPILYHLGVAMPPWGPVRQLLARYTAEASRRGIKSRWWGSARYPAFLRRRLWMMMQKGGVDWVGGDDLADLARFIQRL